MEQKITIPEGYELQKINDSEYRIIKKEVKLPESWIEFCVMHPLQKEERYICQGSEIGKFSERWSRDADKDRNTLPNKEYAEAILALCQLIQLRDCYRQGWKPVWNSSSKCKYSIIFKSGQVQKEFFYENNKILSFQSSEIRDKFYHNFKELIEKIKPLFM